MLILANVKNKMRYIEFHDLDCTIVKKLIFTILLKRLSSGLVKF